MSLKEPACANGLMRALVLNCGIGVSNRDPGRGRAPGKWGGMSPEEIAGPFDSIESAHEYMNVLAATALDVMSDLKRDRDQALRDGEERRAQAIDLALFKLKMLGCYVYKSRRTLNDLRILRRLILNERLSVESIIATM